MITQYLTDSPEALAAIASAGNKTVWVHGSVTYIGEPAAPPPIAPVSRRQMLTALHRAGLLATIKAAVSASDDIEMQLAFDESQEFQRDNAFLQSMALALGKSEVEVDAIFALAAGL